MLTTRRYEYLNIGSIAVHPSIGNHRPVNSAKVSHLEKDILQNGLLEPLVVWERQSGEYYLVGGFHRMEAIKVIRKNNPGYFERVDVRVVAGDPDEIRALNLKLNADRLDTKITDYFETVIYLNNANWTSKRIAEFLDKSVTWIDDIIRYAPMINEKMHVLLQEGKMSWNRAKEIIQKTLKAEAGKEKEIIDNELERSSGRSVKPVTFKSVLKHFSKLSQQEPRQVFSIHVNDMYSFIRVLRGKDYDDEELDRLKSVFPGLIS